MACSLPQFILLKSNKSDKYLRYRKEDDSNHAFLQFSGDTADENVEIQFVKFEVEKSKTVEGFVHIRSCYNNKYWVRKSSWIAAEANEAEEDQSKPSCTLFKPVLVDADVDQDKPQKIRLVHVDQVGKQVYVALADSNLLTLHDNVDGDDNVFTAYDVSSVLPNRTGLKSSIIIRRIDNVNYNLGDSRVHNLSTVSKFRDERQNTTSVAQTAVFNVEYTISKTMVWSDKVWTPSTIPASMFAAVPQVESGSNIVLTPGRHFTVLFGDEQSETQRVAYQMSYSLGPRQKISMSVRATRAQCDVPFSCVVMDTLSNGSVQHYNKNDGLYTGLNEFDFTTSVTTEDI